MNKLQNLEYALLNLRQKLPQRSVLIFLPAGAAGVGVLWPAGLQQLPAVGRGQPHPAL